MTLSGIRQFVRGCVNDTFGVVSDWCVGIGFVRQTGRAVAIGTAFVLMPSLSMAEQREGYGALSSAGQQIVGKTVYQARLSQFDEFPVRPGDIVFVGDNIVHLGAWDEIFQGVAIRNRGIVGETAETLMTRLNRIVERHPSAVVLGIGFNDLIDGQSLDSTVAQISLILTELGRGVPPDHILVLGLPPSSRKYDTSIRQFNVRLARMVTEQGSVFVDVYPALVGRDNEIFPSFAINRGVLSGAGYRVVAELLLPYLITISGERHSLRPYAQRTMTRSDPVISPDADLQDPGGALAETNPPEQQADDSLWGNDSVPKGIAAGGR